MGLDPVDLEVVIPGKREPNSKYAKKIKLITYIQLILHQRLSFKNKLRQSKHFFKTNKPKIIFLNNRLDFAMFLTKMTNDELKLKAKHLQLLMKKTPKLRLDSANFMLFCR